MEARESFEPDVYLTLKEFAQYSHLGMTKARELCREGNKFSFRVGNRIYVSRKKYDEWVAKRAFVFTNKGSLFDFLVCLPPFY